MDPVIRNWVRGTTIVLQGTDPSLAEHCESIIKPEDDPEVTVNVYLVTGH